MTTRIFVCLAVFLASISFIAEGRSQDLAMGIELDPPIECWYHDAFPALDARLDRAAEVEHARLYFRCSLYTEYYFVDLESSPAGFRGVGPMAEEFCPRVHYYVEMLGVDYTASRTEERIAEVTTHDECRRRFPAAALFSGDPRMIIGSTVSSAERMAPGFKLAGVKGFLSAATGQVVSASGGGGISTAAVAGIGAAGAGAAVALAVSTSSDEEIPLATGDSESSAPVGGTPPSPPSPTPPPAPTSTPSTPQSVRACFTIDPVEAVIDPGEAVRLDGRCSSGANLEYSWDLGDGRKRDGGFVTPIYSSPGSFTITLTVRDQTTASLAFAEDSLSKTIRVREPPPTLVPCFVGVPLNLGSNCDMKFDATCSVGDIVAYDWILDQGNVMGAGPYPEAGAVVVHDWTSYPGCVSVPPWPQISVLLTVTARDGSKSSISQSVEVRMMRASFGGNEGAGEASVLSELAAEEPLQGRIRHNDGGFVLTAGNAPQSVRVRPRGGVNRIEAAPVAPLSGEATWRFDFRGTSGFVPGSIEVLSGEVVASDSYSVVLRLDRGRESLRLTYRTLR